MFLEFEISLTSRGRSLRAGRCLSYFCSGASYSGHFHAARLPSFSGCFDNHRIAPNTLRDYPVKPYLLCGERRTLVILWNFVSPASPSQCPCSPLMSTHHRYLPTNYGGRRSHSPSTASPPTRLLPSLVIYWCHSPTCCPLRLVGIIEIPSMDDLPFTASTLGSPAWTKHRWGSDPEAHI